MSEALVKTAKDYGRVKEKLLKLLNKEFLQAGYLNKRNEYWDTVHEVEWDKLDENRRYLDMIFYDLWDIIEFMERKYDMDIGEY